jgi:ribonuclease Z
VRSDYPLTGVVMQEPRSFGVAASGCHRRRGQGRLDRVQRIDSSGLGSTVGSMDRELVVLGTASQTPTRQRNHNGYLLRWDGHGILFDPGEGTQRQLLLAGHSGADVDRICLTHFHGDHCLGVPGVLARMALDQVTGPVPMHHPSSGGQQLHHLLHAAPSHSPVLIQPRPVAGSGEAADTPVGTLIARRLDHGDTHTVGWRLEEPDGVTMVPERLEAAGVHGPDRARLQQDGRLEVGQRTVALEEVSVPRPGQRFAFVMDTRPCDAALALASGVDLLVCESTFLAGEGESDLADRYGHMTARSAARLAVEAGARRLVLVHFSQRHPDEQAFRVEAEEEAAGRVEVLAARDLDRIPVPGRRS